MATGGALAARQQQAADAGAEAEALALAASQARALAALELQWQERLEAAEVARRQKESQEAAARAAEEKEQRRRAAEAEARSREAAAARAHAEAAAASAAARRAKRAELTRRRQALLLELERKAAEREAAAARCDELRLLARGEAERVATLQAKMRGLLLQGADVQVQAAELRSQLLCCGGHNKTQLAAALRGVELLQGPDGADPKLLAMSKLHMLGEVLSALFERLQKRDAQQAEREEGVWTALLTERIAHELPELTVPEGVEEVSQNNHGDQQNTSQLV